MPSTRKGRAATASGPSSRSAIRASTGSGPRSSGSSTSSAPSWRSVAEARRVLGAAVAATVSFWRGEALTGAASDAPTPVGKLALRIVAALEPQDPDLPKLRAPTPALKAALRRLMTAREDLELGRH